MTARSGERGRARGFAPCLLYTSLTLVPMMCAKLVRHRPEAERSRFDRGAERGFNWVIGHYDRALRVVFDHQPLTLFIAVVTLVVTVLLYIVVPKGFFPVQDTGVLQGISVAAQTASFDAMAQHQQDLADVILKDPDVVSLTSFIGVDGSNMTLNTGRFLINLKPKDDRSLDATQIATRTVSYTHLDVYKRQAQNAAPGQPSQSAAPPQQGQVAPSGQAPSEGASEHHQGQHHQKPPPAQ